MQEKVLFINTGTLKQTGWIVGINNSSYAITDVLKIDAGSNKLTYAKNSI